MHGYRGRRNTEYGVRLTEKQKLRYHYGMSKSSSGCSSTSPSESKGNTANTLIQILECRLDNVLRRLGVGRTIWACRQIVGHGHVLVNGVKTDISSFRVKPGQTITFKEGIHKLLRDNMEQNAGHNVPNWLEWNPAQLTATIKSAAGSRRSSIRSEHEPDHRVLSIRTPGWAISTEDVEQDPLARRQRVLRVDVKPFNVPNTRPR